MNRVPAVAVAMFCLLALFWRLDGVPLWRDEATTAAWGRLMVERGTALPYAYDELNGQLLVQDDDGHDVNSKLLPAMQSYLQFYVSAAGHWLFGDGTLAARLPFALFGLGSLALLFWLGRLLRGPTWLPYALPLSASASIYFLHAARQGRYYILVVFATVLLLVAIARYLRDPSLGTRWSFHVHLCLLGCVLYFSNYVSFAATWLALGLFLVLTDRPALYRLCGASAVLALILGTEFWLLHTEFLTAWEPGTEGSFWEDFRYVLSRRGSDYWRWVPFVFLAPAGAFLAWRRIDSHSVAVRAVLAVAAAAPLLGFVLVEPSVRRTGDLTFLLICAAFVTVLVTGWLLWSCDRSRGALAKMALFCALIVAVCPLFTIAVAGRGTLPRYYYQTCPAAVVLICLAAAGLDLTGRRKTAVVLFVGATLWPNFDLAGGGTEQVVLRQYARYDVHNRPMLDYLAEHTQPGQSIAYYRNVKGMVGYYYFPDRRWVNLLDASLPYNQQFRDVLPADQFSDWGEADWFVLWDNRDRRPEVLDDRFELAWEQSYQELRSLWRLGSEPRERSYQIYRRREPAATTSGP